MKPLMTVAALAAAAALAACGTYTGVDELAANGDPLECRVITQTGSSVGQRYCATAQEWADWEAGRTVETRDWMRRMQSSAARPTGGGNPLNPQ